MPGFDEAHPFRLEVWAYSKSTNQGVLFNADCRSANFRIPYGLRRDCPYAECAADCPIYRGSPLAAAIYYVANGVPWGLLYETMMATPKLVIAHRPKKFEDLYSWLCGQGIFYRVSVTARHPESRLNQLINNPSNWGLTEAALAPLADRVIAMSRSAEVPDYRPAETVPEDYYAQ